MNQVDQQFSAEKARQARVLMGLTQKQVAEDLREKSDGLLKITNTQLSRFEKGDIALDDQTKGYLKSYLNSKLVEFNRNEETTQAAEETNNNVVEDKNADAIKITKANDEKAKSAADEPTKKEPKLLAFDDLMLFDPKLSELKKDLLIQRFRALYSQLEEAIDRPVKRGWFGVSEEAFDDAKACVYTMAGLYNILRALQGKPVFPIADSPENVLGKEDILSLVQGDWNFFTGQGPVVEPTQSKA